MVTALPLQPPVLPMLPGIAVALPAGFAVRPTSAALHGAMLPEDEGLVLKRPQHYFLAPPLTLPWGREGQSAGRGEGLGTPNPLGEGQVLPLVASRCPYGGASRFLPLPQRPRWGEITTSPCRVAGCPHRRH